MSVNFKYTPLHHPKQILAAPNHVILLFFDGDAEIMPKIRWAETKAGVSVTMIIFMIVVVIFFSIMAIVFEQLMFVYLAIGTLIFSILICIYAYINRNKLDQLSLNLKKCYSYYCYDISDQCIKLIIINKKKHQKQNEK